MYIYYIVLIMLYALTDINGQSNVVNHKLNITINPQTSYIEVIDNIKMPDQLRGKLKFYLNSDLKITNFSKEIKIKKIKAAANGGDRGMDIDFDTSSTTCKVDQYMIDSVKPGIEFSITYNGTIKSELKQSVENYQRGFAESAGIISETGVYLAGSTYWIPQFDDCLVSFDISTKLPEKWTSISQGDISMSGGVERWICTQPQEEIFLIAGKFFTFSSKLNNGVMVMSYLRNKDDEIANKYISATEQYMDMYENLIGKYPYSKFALVENFWETGYGMPSFTLLGEKIIRMPFILYSSYPHELLHNWWGNSVYVDRNKGNWCEGLTAYLADYLLKEQKHQGAEYRRTTLQKYSDFVSTQSDFPLSKFTSRYNSSSEVVGYGKSMMMFHMLRNEIGDHDFKEGLKDFYLNNKFKNASFSDIEKSMSKVSKKDLNNFFNQWVNNTGAPEIKLKTAKKGADGKIIEIELEEMQGDFFFPVKVPVVVTTTNGIQKFDVSMDKPLVSKVLKLDSEPLKIDIDPFFDVFRKVNPDEVPPALSKIYGTSENLIILPSNADELELQIYKDFVKQWIDNDKKDYNIIFDNESIDKNFKGVKWIIGEDNIYINEVTENLKRYNSDIDFRSKDKDFIFTFFDKSDHNRQNIFLSLHNSKSIEGLVRKLPHYSKYSYLAFYGDEPVNVIKGQWNVLLSPMTYKFVDQSNYQTLNDDREPLIELKPVFSKEKMLETITFLASSEIKGRGLGTPELDKAADYIASKMKDAGLKPVNDSYYQSYRLDIKDKGVMDLKNVVGFIEGSDPNLKNNAVVISAHYDHLGLGWPDVHAGNEGKIHPGADDNASGVSIMLELARCLGKDFVPKRSIIFVAFTGEEAGMIGSKYFVSHFKELFDGIPFANVNLDTDGRLFNNKIQVFNANSAKEWKYIFQGTDYTTGILTHVVENAVDASDQVSFLENGIPAIQIFAGANEDYHRPTDIVEKIDGEGLVKIATVAKEVLEYLAQRVENIEFISGNEAKKEETKPTDNASRKASTGGVPDFAYTGPGVKLSSIVSGSQGEKAGLKKDDIIMKFNGVEIQNLKQYSEELKKFSPGQKVEMEIMRDSEIIIVQIVLGAR